MVVMMMNSSCNIPKTFLSFFNLVKVLMLTLQNDSPTLDTGAQEKDQYKSYSKVFRKMITECLRKEPEKR